jgi:ABC-type multidrug transport system permease subunit
MNDYKKVSRISFFTVLMFFFAIVGTTYLLMESLADIGSFWTGIAILSFILIVISAFISMLRH